jgi:MFS family permease
VAWVSFGVAGAIGPMLGGWIATHAQPLAAGVFTWSRYHWLFLLSVALQLPALLLWQRLKVEGSQPPMMMVAWLLRRVTERRMG